MKNKIAAFIMVFVAIFVSVIPGAAAAVQDDGTYEVAITLLHAEKEKSSMGNNYIVQRALLEVRDGKKYLTMVPARDVDNLQFWYYNDGSVSGDSTEASKTANVTIGGKTYSVGYTFPIVADGETTVGVRFKAPIMPVTPSARVEIDYDSAVPIPAPPPAETTQPPQTTAAPETETNPTTAPAPITATTVPVATQEITQPTTQAPKITAATTEPQTTFTAPAAQIDETAVNAIASIVKALTFPLIVIATLIVLLIVTAIFLFVRFFRKNRKRE